MASSICDSWAARRRARNSAASAGVPATTEPGMRAASGNRALVLKAKFARNMPPAETACFQGHVVPGPHLVDRIWLSAAEDSPCWFTGPRNNIFAGIAVPKLSLSAGCVGEDGRLTFPI